MNFADWCVKNGKCVIMDIERTCIEEDGMPPAVPISYIGEYLSALTKYIDWRFEQMEKLTTQTVNIVPHYDATNVRRKA